MSDIKLTSDGSDIDISSAGLELVEGIDAIAQHLLIRLRFFQGEWFLDIRLGIPYFQKILVKAPNLVLIRAIYREGIIETPGVEEILRFDLQFEVVTRKVTIDFSVKTTTGEVLDFSREFIIGD